MLNFTLANGVSLFEINSYFLELIGANRFLLKEDVNYNQIQADISNNPWGGGYNNISKEIIMAPGLEKYFIDNNLFISRRLNFSNITLKEIDFYNNYNRLILNAGANGSTTIEISNLALYEYIKKNYPIYNKYILSSDAWQIISLTPEMINVILENEDFQLVSVPPYLNNDLTFLKQIKDKKKIELTINPLCSIDCKNYKDCVLFENTSNHNFSEKSVFKTCNKQYSYVNNPQTISIENLKKKYESIGITHFKLAEFPMFLKANPKDGINYLQFLIKYFIKEEYQTQVLEDYFR